MEIFDFQNFAHRQLTCCWNQPWWPWLTCWCGLRYFAVMGRLAKGKSLVPLLLCTTQGHYRRESWSLGGVQNIELPVSCTADLNPFLCVYLCVFKRMSVVSGWVCWCVRVVRPGSQLRSRLDLFGASEKLLPSCQTFCVCLLQVKRQVLYLCLYSFMLLKRRTYIQSFTCIFIHINNFV